VTVSQAYAVVRFLFVFAIPVGVFVYCYGCIFRTIRRQSKVISGHVGQGRDVPVATTSRDPGDAGQIQQQATGATSDAAKLSRTELNVLKTMIAVIACFMIFWAAPALNNLLQPFGVSIILRHVSTVNRSSHFLQTLL